MNEIAFVEAEKFLKELAHLRLRARETAQIIRREEAPESIAVAIEATARELLAASSAVSSQLYSTFANADASRVQPDASTLL